MPLDHVRLHTLPDTPYACCMKEAMCFCGGAQAWPRPSKPGHGVQVDSTQKTVLLSEVAYKKEEFMSSAQVGDL